MLRIIRDNLAYAAEAVPAGHRRRHQHFLAVWMRAPLKVGAFVPSSRALARSMAEQVNPDVPGAVIELGAGTGAVTNALVQAGIADRLLVVERDTRFHAILAVQFPHLNVVCADAAELKNMLEAHKVEQVNSVVSSLPLLSMPKAIRHALAESMLAVLGENGVLVQFTYGPKSPVSRDLLRKYGFTGRRVKTVLANVPPAHVWVYRRVQA